MRTELYFLVNELSFLPSDTIITASLLKALILGAQADYQKELQNRSTSDDRFLDNKPV